MKRVVKKKYEYKIFCEDWGLEADDVHHGAWRIGLENAHGVKYPTIWVSGTPIACGIGSMYGISSFGNIPLNEIKRLIKRIASRARRDDIGTILTALGENYIDNYEHILLECGFKKINEYTNHVHAHKQRLYALNIK